MPRITQAEQYKLEIEAEALVFFRNLLSSLTDPRRKQGTRYPLMTIVVIALMAIICGAEDAQAIETWGDIHQEWLSTFLPMPHGVPTQDVYLSVLGALETQQFEHLFQSCAQLLKTRLKGQQIALDGKTSRRSYDRGKEKGAIHTLNAWAVESGIVVK